MSMEQITEEDIVKINEYFKHIPRVRYSDWISEMRRSISTQLSSQGVSSLGIAKILHTNRSSPCHYLNVIPRNECRAVVDLKIWEWIESKLYPKSTSIVNNKTKSSYLGYELRTVENMNEPIKKNRTPKKRGRELDRFIDNL
jgi:hypothetical protein